MSPPTVISVAGAAGRMGQCVVRAILERDDCRLGAALVRPESPAHGSDIGILAGLKPCGVAAGAALPACDVLIDFSTPAAFAQWLGVCVERGIAFLSGTTGLDDAARSALEEAAERIPLMWAPNLSLGAHLLAVLAEQAARALGGAADIEIIEAHHRHKKDAPSGTALALGERLARAVGTDFEPVARTAHGGPGAARATGEIGIASLRGGDIVGEHTVLFALAGERLELTHRASSREAFVAGALRAAIWLSAQPPGRYRFDQLFD